MAKAVAVESGASETRFIPWEDRSESSRGRLVRSWVLLVTQPGEFYRRMSLCGGMGEPFGFQMISVAVGFAATLVYFLIWGLAKPDHALVSWFPGVQSRLAFIFNMTCVFALVTPVAALAAVVKCLVLGLVARLVAGRGERGAGVEAYYSVFAYATGPTALAVVPAVGLAAAVVLGIAFAYKGMRSAIGLKPVASVGAIAAPAALVAVLVALGVILL